MFPSWTIVAAVSCGLLALFGSAVGYQDPDVNSTNSNAIPEAIPTGSVKQVLGKECKGGYSPHCLKLSLIYLIGRSGSFNWPVLPGVSINSPGLSGGGALPENNLLTEPEKVDGLLLGRLSEYLSTLSINVEVMDKTAPLGLARTILGNDLASATARKKGQGNLLMGVGLMSGGTLAALALAALAAMAGKALMASLLALMLAALSALKGGGGGGSEKTTYEIVAKPVVSHLATHSSEVQHGHHGGHYRRSMDVLPDLQPIVYSAHIPIARR